MHAGEDFLRILKAARRRAARAANTAPTLRSRWRSRSGRAGSRLDRRGQGTLGPLRRQTVAAGCAGSGVDSCARRVECLRRGHSGSGMAPNRVRLVVAGAEVCPSRPPTSQDKPSRAAGGGEGRSVMECSTITTAGGPAPQRVGTTANGMASPAPNAGEERMYRWKIP